jgi:hypothetical protein
MLGRKSSLPSSPALARLEQRSSPSFAATTPPRQIVQQQTVQRSIRQTSVALWQARAGRHACVVATAFAKKVCYAICFYSSDQPVRAPDSLKEFACQLACTLNDYM